MVRLASFGPLLSPLLLLWGCGSSDEGSGPGGGGDGGGDTPRLLEYAPPSELGPYAIGFSLHAFVDESRPERSTADDGDNRTLPTVVWYPADDSARDEPKATFDDYLAPSVQAALGALAPNVTSQLSMSVKDAPVASDGPFPLIVFSHGNSGIGVQSYFLTEFLASHGYIVVCPDHTGNALMTELPGGVVITPGGEGGMYALDAQVSDRPDDVSFLVDVMGELSGSDPEGRFEGKVDLEHVGITGHSFGGLTTLLAMERDERFDVGAPMTPAVPETANIDNPVQYFLATEDQTLPGEPIEAHYDRLDAPKMMVRVVDAGHFSFSNGCPLGIGAGDGCGTATRGDTGETFTFLADSRVHEITRYYQTALFGYYLKGVTAYADDLLAEPFGAEVDLERSGLPE